MRANEPNLGCAQGLSENQAHPHRGLPALCLNPGQSGLQALQDGLQVRKPFFGRQTALTVEPVHLRRLCGPDKRVCCRSRPAGCRARFPRARWSPSGRAFTGGAFEGGACADEARNVGGGCLGAAEFQAPHQQWRLARGWTLARRPLAWRALTRSPLARRPLARSPLARRPAREPMPRPRPLGRASWCARDPPPKRPAPPQRRLAPPPWREPASRS